MDGFVEYLAEIDDKLVKIIYYHNLMGNYFAIEGRKGFHSALPTNITDMVEIRRSPELSGVVFTH